MKQKFYFFDYIKEKKPAYLDSIKFELDSKIYFYGDQFLYGNEKGKYMKFFKNIRSKCVDIYRLIINYSYFKPDFSYAISGAYFGFGENLSIKSACVPWQGPQICSWKQYKKLRRYQRYLSNSNMTELLSPDALSRYDETMHTLREIYTRENIKYLIVPQDMSPFERMSVKVFKEIGKKSFVFLHGLPGRYNNIDDNRADYLIVWGQKLKELYTSIGVNPDKIFISGHPSYKNYLQSNSTTLRNSNDNILVLTKSMNGAQHADGVRLTDRGNLILYLWMVESVLKSLGVSSVKLRPHPSESISWYYKFIDKNFFQADDNKNISDSLKQASLVIGPTSTVLLDALMNGVNYLVFEPAEDKIDLINFPLVTPFDKSDPRVSVSFNEAELKKAILNHDVANPAILEDYIQKEFDVGFIDLLT